MSTKTAVTVFARDNDKPGNREVVAFLEQHLRQLVQAGLHFTFVVTDTKIERELAARRIGKLPAIEVKRGEQTVSFMTPIEIKSALLKFLGERSGAATRKPRPAEDEMSEYYAKEMNFERYEAEQDAGDEDDAKRDLADRAKEEWVRRQSTFEKKPEARGRRKAGRRDNVRATCAACGDDPCTCEAPTRGPDRRAAARDEPSRKPASEKPRTPQDRLRQAGGDPGNKDDQLIMEMLSVTDE